LIAEGERWRWQRQLLSPLFRAEEIAGYVPAYAPVLAHWNKADRGYSTDMAATILQVLEDTVLGVDLATEDHRRIAAAGTAHCVARCLCLTPIKPGAPSGHLAHGACEPRLA
jgi:cytochrome P450